MNHITDTFDKFCRKSRVCQIKAKLCAIVPKGVLNKFNV